MKAMRSISTMFAAIGALLLVGTFFLWNSTRQFVAKAITSQGMVVDLVEDRDSDGVTYAPVVRFTTPGGREITYTESFSGNPAPYDVGDPVEVLYSADNPGKSRVKGFMSLWLGPVILTAIGAPRPTSGSY
jgi:hypothetical protein